PSKVVESRAFKSATSIVFFEVSASEHLIDGSGNIVTTESIEIVTFNGFAVGTCEQGEFMGAKFPVVREDTPQQDVELVDIFLAKPGLRGPALRANQHRGYAIGFEATSHFI